MPVQHQVRLLDQAPHVGARVVTGHRMIGVAEQRGTVFRGYSRCAQAACERVLLIPIAELEA